MLPRKKPSSSQNAQSERRPFLGIHFHCCNTYARIYRNAQKTAYTGACPRCGKKVHVPIGEGGSRSRFFTAY